MATYQFTGRIIKITTNTNIYNFLFDSDYKVKVQDSNGNDKIYSLAQNTAMHSNFQEIPNMIISNNGVLTTLLMSNIKESFEIEYDDTSNTITKVTLIND